MYQTYIANMVANQLVLSIIPVCESEVNYQLQLQSKNKITYLNQGFLLIVFIPD